MKVFICWGGKLSKEVASILHEYIHKIIQSLEVFVSQHDIDSGARWNFRLVEELSNTNFGILCLTPENLNNTWLLFEAGLRAMFSVKFSAPFPDSFTPNP